MARFFNFSNTEEFVLELQPSDLLSAKERAYYGRYRRKRSLLGVTPRQEAEKRNELRVIGRFERLSVTDRRFFLN